MTVIRAAASDPRTTPRERPRRVVVTGTGVVSPLGDSRQGLHEALVAGRAGFLTLPELAGGSLPAPTAAAVPDFDPERYLGEVNLRPLDRTGRLAASAARLALLDAGLAEGAPGELLGDHELGLVVGTVYGSVRTIAELDRRGMEAGPLYVKPFDFANSVINAAAGQTAIHHRLRGPNTTVSGGAASGVQAIALGADLVAAGQADVVLAGGAEELSFEALFAFARAGLLTDGQAPRPLPFDARRAGFLLGEGAAFLVLETPEGAAARGARPVAEVLGQGSCFDFSLGADEGAATRAIARAVGDALADAGVAADAIVAVSAAASGAIASDRREAEGLARALGRQAGKVLVSAPKGLFGEALGASGALQAAALLAAMEAGVLPGVPGLGNPGPDFPLTAADPEDRRAELPVTLLDGIGLDGHCCVLVLGRAERP